MITILQIFPNYMTHGGMEAFLMNYFRNRNPEKISFVFLQLSKEKGEYDDEITSSGGFVEHYSGSQHNVWKYSVYLKSIIKKYDPDLIHVHGDAFSVMTYISLWMTGFKKVIAHSHNTSQPSKFLIGIKKHLTTKLSRYHFACSEEAGKWLYGKNVVNSDKFYVINNAIDAEHYAFKKEYRTEIRQKYCIDDDCFTIGCVGHLVDSHKNQSFLIKLISKIKDKKNIKLILVGDGVDRDMLLDKARSYGVFSDVIFVTDCSDSSKFYSSFDCFCLPSHYEGLGIVCVEAIASGLSPIISENVPIIPELSKYERQISLCDDFCVWEKEIMSSKRNCSQLKEVEQSNYSIKKASDVLLEIYLKLVNDND